MWDGNGQHLNNLWLTCLAAPHKIETKPGFRRMHECVQHVGIVSRLDVWRLAANTRFPGVETLEDFSKLEPKWDVLQEMARQIAMRNPTPSDFSRMCV